MNSRIAKIIQCSDSEMYITHNSHNSVKSEALLRKGLIVDIQYSPT